MGVYSLSAASGLPSWSFALIMGVMIVGLMLMTIIPQRKQKKKMEAMFSNLAAGDKVMTIGGFVGEIVSIDTATDRFVLNVGTEEAPVNVTVIRNSIRTKL